MASIGLNIARDGSTPIALIRSFNVTWVRIVALPDVDLSHYFMDIAANGIRILLVLARESGGDYALYQRRYGALVHAIEVGNEPDISSPSSWTMTQQELSVLGKTARAIFPKIIPLVVGGLASGHPEWLDSVDLDPFDAIAFHPYLKDAPSDSDIEDLQDVTELVARYRQFGKPVLITEWGWWDQAEPRASEETRDMVYWAGQTSTIEVFFYFCASDAMVPPFGLTNADGSDKPRAEVFRHDSARAVNSEWPHVAITPEPVDLRAYARAAAIRNALSPLHFERQIQQESRFDPNAYNPASGATGIAQLVPRFHPGVDVHNPLASLDYAAAWMVSLVKQFGSLRKALVAYNWGPGNTSTWDEQASTLPRETRHYLDVILGPGWPEPQTPTGRVTYNRNEPAHPQEESFDCSQESLEWALWAYGRQTSDDWLENTMIAEGVLSRTLGLLDASGAGLAAFIRKQYSELGFDSNSTNPVTFDALVAEFGPGNPYPGLIGGRAWNHWSGLRTADPVRDVLMLANPSDGHKGVGQTMTRSQFNALGPFSLVRVIHKDVLTPDSPPVSGDKDALIASYELALRTLRDTSLPATNAALAECDRIVKQYIGDA